MSENFGVNSSFKQTQTQSEGSTCNNLVENHAAQLMDELFQALDGNGDLLEGKQATPSSLKSAPSAASQLALAVKTDELQDNLSIPYVEMDAILEPFYTAEPVLAPIDNVEKSESFLLPGLAWGAFLGSLGLFAFTQFNAFTHAPATVQAAVPSVAVAEPQDVAFATGVSELLQSSENVVAAPPPVAINALPTISQSSIPAVVASPTQMPSTSILPGTAPSGTALPSVTPQAKGGVGRKKQAAVTFNPKNTQKSQTIALSTLNNRLPVLNGNQNQVATAYVPPALPLNPTPQSLPMGSQAKSGITINMILDLGPKSAILISRNGSTQNIRPGEVLDATGWVFSQVKNGQAVLQRGNETRAVGIGEQF